jgi:hypothetical protein
MPITTMENFNQEEKKNMIDYCAQMKKESEKLKGGLKYSFTTLFSTFRMKRLASNFDKQIAELEKAIRQPSSSQKNTDALVSAAYQSLDKLKSLAGGNERRADAVKSLQEKMDETIIKTSIASKDNILSIDKTLYGKRINEIEKQDNALGAAQETLRKKLTNPRSLIKNNAPVLIHQLQTFSKNIDTQITECQKSMEETKADIASKQSDMQASISRLQFLSSQAENADKPKVGGKKVPKIAETNAGSFKVYKDTDVTEYEKEPDLEARLKAHEDHTQELKKYKELKAQKNSSEEKLNILNNEIKVLTEEKEKLNSSSSWIKGLNEAAGSDTIESDKFLQQRLPLLNSNENQAYQEIATIINYQAKNSKDKSIGDTFALLKAMDPSAQAKGKLESHLDEKGCEALRKQQAPAPEDSNILTNITIQEDDNSQEFTF